MPAAAGSEFLGPTPTACSKDCSATQQSQASGRTRLGLHILAFDADCIDLIGASTAHSTGCNAPQRGEVDT